MNLPPHLHCLVTGGALGRDGSAFVQAPKNFLFPHRSLARVFRAVFLNELNHLRRRDGFVAGPPELADDAAWKTLMRSLHRNDRVVLIEAPFAEPGPLIRYLGRYVNRIAIANHRIESIDGGRIVFCYRDNSERDPDAPGAQERMCLSVPAFIHRSLQHVLPPGFHYIRY